MSVSLRARRYTGLQQRASRLWHAEPFLPHRYTRTAAADAQADPYGDTGVGYAGAPVSDLPCQLQEHQLLGRDPVGNPVTVVQLALLVPPDDPIAGRDKITNVLDPRTGQVLQPGPLYVDYIRNVEPWGALEMREAVMARLEGTG